MDKNKVSNLFSYLMIKLPGTLLFPFLMSEIGLFYCFPN